MSEIHMLSVYQWGGVAEIQLLSIYQGVVGGVRHPLFLLPSIANSCFHIVLLKIIACYLISLYSLV